MSPDLDLFERAARRVVVDAQQIFLRRQTNFIRQLIIGYRPPTSGGAPPIDLATYREARAARPANERSKEQAVS